MSNSSVTYASHGVADPVRVADALREHLGADTAVGREQREQQLVLAREAPVEGLQRQPGPLRDLRDRERGAPRLVREVARGLHEAVGPGFERPSPRAGRTSFSHSITRRAPVATASATNSDEHGDCKHERE